MHKFYRSSLLTISLLLIITLASSLWSEFTSPADAGGSSTQSPGKQLERERERAYAREQFSKNFRDLQLKSQGLLREHEAAKLTPDKLNKDVKAINKSARTLRTLIALGDMANEVEIDKDLSTEGDFDEAIRKLAELIREFAHNPVHQNSKVFNTIQAERAQTDLLTIINLSKAIENRSKEYIRPSRKTRR